MKPADSSRAVVKAILSWRYAYLSETQLQEGLAEALASAGLPTTREVALGAGHGRIDLMSGRVGIEVKVAGARSAVLRQLTRYATSGRIDNLILVTTRVRHDMPDTIAGIPIVVVSLAMAAL